MIHLLYGDDEFSLRESLSSMKEAVGTDDLRDVNITVLNGTQVSFDELAATCDTVPFLADMRMVIVEGLLSMFEWRPQTRAGAASSRRALGPWEGLPEYLSRTPQTTDLVFVEERLTQSNALLAKIRPLAKIQTFPLPTGAALGRWIRERAAKLEVDIEPGAVGALADSIGGNLRLIDQELRKLSLFRRGEPVRAGDVEELVADTKETNIFAAVDAVIEGRTGTALRLVRRLLDSGRTPGHLISMIARQVRLLLLAKDLRANNVAGTQMGSRLSLSGYPLRKTLEQEGRFTSTQLVVIHRKLLEADLAMKTGPTDEHLVLETLVADMAASDRQSE